MAIERSKLIERSSLGIDYADSEDSDEERAKEDDLEDGEDEDFIPMVDEPTSTKETNPMIRQGVLGGCSSIVSRVAGEVIVEDGHRKKSKLEEVFEDSDPPPQHKRKKAQTLVSLLV